MSLPPASVLLAGVALALSGCGSGDEYPPAAEPPASPSLRIAPAGMVSALPGEPEGLAVDSRSDTVAAALRNPDRIALLNGSNGRVRKLVSVNESARHLTVVEPARLLVPAERSDQLIELRLPSGETVSRTDVGSFPHDATRIGNVTVVADELDGTVSLLQDGERAEVVPTGGQPGGVAAGRGLALVVDVRERRLRAIDPSSAELKADVEGGIGPTHLVFDGGNRVYVADTDGHALLAYEVAPKLRFVDRVNLPSAPYGVAVDRRRHRLWVTLPARNRLIEFRIPEVGGSVRRAATYPTVRQPNSVAVNVRDGTVFVAGRKPGRLQIIQSGEIK